MAEIRHDGDYEEYYAEFVRIDGKRGTVLIFVGDDLEADKNLAEEIAAIMDKVPA